MLFPGTPSEVVILPSGSSCFVVLEQSSVKIIVCFRFPWKSDTANQKTLDKLIFEALLLLDRLFCLHAKILALKIVHNTQEVYLCMAFTTSKCLLFFAVNLILKHVCNRSGKRKKIYKKGRN